MTPIRRRATQVDIARAVGVSQATVSMVLSGAAEQVAVKTRDAVLAAARELGYSVNISARSLRGGRNRIIGLFTFEPVFPIEQRDFYYPFLVGVEHGAAEHGHELLLFTSAGASGTRRVYATGENRLKVADGCVLLGRQVDADDLSRLASEDFPFVFIGHREVDGAELSFVAADYRSATRTLVERLLAAGHRRIVYVRGAGEHHPTRDREQGLWDAWDAAGLRRADIAMHVIDDAETIGADRLRAWIDTGATAVVAEPTAERRVEEELHAAALEAGIRIPEDCSVAILGDSPEGNGGPDWARFSLPRTQMGQVAVELLLELIEEGGPARQRYLECEQVDGASIAAPRRGGVG
ncbi:MAG: LacI family DNA-binding transcriptional regulator [Microbacterium sp.]